MESAGKPQPQSEAPGSPTATASTTVPSSAGPSTGASGSVGGPAPKQSPGGKKPKDVQSLRLSAYADKRK
eukprot:9657591-Alexandrium_andersonii.AAC.1